MPSQDLPIMGSALLHTLDITRRYSGSSPLSIRMAITLFLLFCCCPYRGYGDLAGDANGLLVFKKAVDIYNSLPWDVNGGGGGNVCQWQGIECSGTPSSSTLRVTSLRLPGASLSGHIPEGSIGQLRELRVLSLRSNRLFGSLPADFANCTLIRSIYLQHNHLSGPLPTNFTLWPNLLHVDLSFNNFNTTLPPSLGYLNQLKSLFLQNNSLSGPIPAINISSLSKFSVAYNQLDGAIPDTFTYRNFTQASFLGNNLCGFPLPPCSAEAPGSGAGFGPGGAPQKNHRRLTRGAIAGIVIGVAFFLLFLAFLCLLAFRKGRAKVPNDKEAMEAPSVDGGNGIEAATTRTDYAAATASDSHHKKLVFFEGVNHAFELEDLLRASAEVLGKGSVGTAYKAVLESGSIVAVKRLKDVTIERQDFEQHMASIGRLKHGNLVPFIAYYYSKDEKLLVNDYMMNGSLSALLHGNKGVTHTPLDWGTRVHIALGAALGIDYLHDHMCTHGNIKSSNILLTANFTSCVSDYGMAQLLSATPVANRIVGYRAPEVTDIKRVTPKADVYSYGVLLLELLTARAPWQAAKGEDGVDLPRWVQSVVKERWTAEVFDEDLTKYIDIEEEEMVQMLHIAITCVAPSPDQRPTMKEVVKLLEDIRREKHYGEEQN